LRYLGQDQWKNLGLAPFPLYDIVGRAWFADDTTK
jgi:hypothetical protein